MNKPLTSTLDDVDLQVSVATIAAVYAPLPLILGAAAVLF